MGSVAVVSRVQYDAHTRIIDLDTSWTMDEVVKACLAPAVGYQLKPPNPNNVLRVRHTTDDDSASPYPRDMTVDRAGWKHLECIDVFAE
jgi:ActR/RegA family two-component response regulator